MCHHRDKEASGSSPPREREGERGRGRDGGGSGEDDDDAEERRGGGGCGAGQRDFLAERRAEMDAMRAEATNRTYGRMKTTTEVGACRTASGLRLGEVLMYSARALGLCHCRTLLLWCWPASPGRVAAVPPRCRLR